MQLFRPLSYSCLAVVAIISASLPAAAQAVLSLDVGTSLVRGTKAPIALNLTVKAKGVSFHKLYVKLRCKEVIDLTQSVTEEKEEKGKKVSTSKSVNVKREEVLFEREIVFPAGKDKEYAPGSTQTLKAELEIPADLPPSFRGKFTQIKWEAQAQGDVVGKFWDATSGLTEIIVK